MAKLRNLNSEIAGSNPVAHPKLIQVQCDYCTAGIVVDENNVIKEAAPILHWFRGLHLSKLMRYKRLERVLFIPAGNQK